MGRPRIHGSETKLSIQMSEELRDAIKREAARDSQHESSWARAVLAEEIERRTPPTVESLMETLVGLMDDAGFTPGMRESARTAGLTQRDREALADMAEGLLDVFGKRS